jgi:hypothetical protein
VHIPKEAEMHLTESTLDPYLARSLDRKSLSTLDDHVAGCVRCTFLVEAAGLDEERWERRGLFGRLVRVEPQRAAAVELERAA